MDSRIGIFNTPGYVLVAESADAQPEKDSAPVTNYLSIAGLTVLGSFTGMGVTWIVYAIIAAVWKFPADRLFESSLVWPLLITGWILGAVIGFFYSRPVFKSDGRSGYSRNQNQRNYMVRLDARVNLEWSMFLGMPAPLIALVIFILGRLPLTLEQKAYGSLAVSMVILGATMYLCDRIPRRLLFWLGPFGWLLALIMTYWFFSVDGP
ncbi:MAG TPA: hypothetical protein VGJ73_04360 [Verrucomicrobiae bacterium]